MNNNNNNENYMNSVHCVLLIDMNVQNSVKEFRLITLAPEYNFVIVVESQLTI